jgi:very-short-patch-repair endonuclease
METLDRDLALATLSRRQFGAVARHQLLELGFSATSIRRAVERGRLVKVFPRVYRVDSVPVTLEQRQMCATLFGGNQAALCNSSAAQVLGFIPSRPSAIHIRTPRRVVSKPGLEVHHRLWLPGECPTRIGPLPVTSAARTILDLCGERHSFAEMALDTALRVEAVSLDDLDHILKLGSRYRISGTTALRDLVAVRGEEEAMSESELESSVIRVLRRAGLSLPERQVTVEWDRCHRLDFCYPAHNLIIEVDGRKWHASRERFQLDRHRDNSALLEGKRVIRFTWEDVIRDEPYVVGTVRKALGIQALL